MGWVAILDWDAHHGNGVAAYADEEERACYASVHQAPLWPGTGDDASDRGPRGNRLSQPVPRACEREAYELAWASCLAFCDDFAQKQSGPGLASCRGARKINWKETTEPLESCSRGRALSDKSEDHSPGRCLTRDERRALAGARERGLRRSAQRSARAVPLTARKARDCS